MSIPSKIGILGVVFIGPTSPSPRAIFSYYDSNGGVGF